MSLQGQSDVDEKRKSICRKAECLYPLWIIYYIFRVLYNSGIHIKPFKFKIRLISKTQFIQIEILFTNPSHVFIQCFSQKPSVCILKGTLPVLQYTPPTLSDSQCVTQISAAEHIPHIGLRCQNQAPTTQQFDFISIVLFSLRPVSWWRMAFWWRCRKAPGRFGTSSSSPTCCSVPRWRRRLWGESTLPFILHPEYQNSLYPPEPFACAALNIYYCRTILFASICMSFIFPSTSARKPPTVKQKRVTLALYKRYCHPVCIRLCKARELIEASLTKRKTSRHFASGFLRSGGRNRYTQWIESEDEGVIQHKHSFCVPEKSDSAYPHVMSHLKPLTHVRRLSVNTYRIACRSLRQHGGRC